MLSRLVCGSFFIILVHVGWLALEFVSLGLLASQALSSASEVVVRAAAALPAAFGCVPLLLCGFLEAEGDLFVSMQDDLVVGFVHAGEWLRVE